MDFSMDMAEFMMLDDDKRRWMDESALFAGLFVRRER